MGVFDCFYHNLFASDRIDIDSLSLDEKYNLVSSAQSYINSHICHFFGIKSVICGKRIAL